MKTLTKLFRTVTKNSFIKTVFTLLIAFSISNKANAQCANNNVYYTGITTLNPGQSYVFGCVFGGEYVTVPVVSGVQYTFSTCGGGSWDTQLTIYNNTGGSSLGYNDDFCGLQSSIAWTANFTGTLRILLDQYSCLSNSSCMNVTVTRASAPSPAYNPCTSISNLNCNVNTNANITSGNGVWSSFGGPYTTPGRERLFSFTPSITGLHNITINHTTSGWIDLFYKAANIGCNATSWTYVNDISGSETWGVTLTAGVTYYILLDDEDVNGSNATISISCPVPCVGPTNGIDFTFNAPFNHSSTTIGSCNDCSLRPSNDRTYQVNITCPGTYVFSLCNNASWDTYLYLNTQVCGGTPIASNDDACGLQSEIITYLNVGTYYLTIEGFSSTSEGAYAISVSGGGPSITGNPVIGGSSNVCAGSTSNYNVSGVIGATSYNWNISGGTIISGQGSANITVAWGNNNGALSVVPTSACGNGPQANYNVTVNNIPVITVSANNVNCFGNNNGSINISPANSNWVYSIDGGANYGSNTAFSNLSPGNYNVVAQVNNLPGCSSSPQSVGITQPSQLVSSIVASNYNGYNISCNGGNNGSATVNVNGGTTPYTYNWSNSSTSNSASNLTAQSYNVNVSDANGCTSSSNITLTEPSALSSAIALSNFNGYNISCNGGSNGSATVSVSGGVTPYSYSWSNSSTSNFASNLSAQAYNVSITDANGCNNSVSATLTEPSALSSAIALSNFNGYNVSCNGGSNGSATVNVTGGVTPYSYSWSNSSTSNVASNLSAQAYNVSITDANGCNNTASTTLTEPSALTSAIAASNYNGYNISCNGGSNGSATVNVSGGVTPYSYNWSNSSTASSASNLSAQAYNVTITDANGCNSSANITLTEPSALTMNMSSNQVVYVGYGPFSCATISTSISGGINPYSYNWSNNSSQQVTSVCPTVTTVYTVTATDANGCTISGTVKVCAINVVCYAGNSPVAKVSVCHVPPGNPQNPQQICISANAVAAHLAQGSYLGACNGNTVCNSSSSRGVNELNEEKELTIDLIKDFNIYPNPTQSELTFEFYCFENGRTSFDIKDVTGRIVMQGTESETSANQTRINTLSVKEFAPGVYFISIKHNNSIVTKKFVVEK